MDPYFDSQTTTKLIHSAVIAAVALLLFVGLRNRLLHIARWARLPQLALNPVRIALRYTILVAAVLLIMSRWDLPVGGILGALGTTLGLVAIGFVAMWSVLSNFLCTVVLLIMKPFNVGDEVELPTVNVRGRVADLSPVFTTLESQPGEVVMVPNNMFFQVVFKRRRGAVTTDLESHFTRSPFPKRESGDAGKP